MLQFNQLRITPDGKKLIVDISVRDMEYYQGVYVNSVIIDTQKTYDVTGPSSNPLFTFDYSGQEKKHITEYIDVDSIADNLFFVYAFATGDAEPDTPCGMKKTSIMGVVYDKSALYKNGMKFISSVKDCNFPREFIDYILRYKAFDLALDSCNYTQAIEYWNNYISKSRINRTSKRCRCHG